MKKILSILAIAVAMVSCNKDTEVAPLIKEDVKTAFMANETVGMYSASGDVYKFDKATQQMLWYSATKEFCIQDDDQSRYFAIELGSTMYTKPNIAIAVDISIKGIGEYKSENKNLLTIKYDDEKKMLWLWDTQYQVGYIVYTEL